MLPLRRCLSACGSSPPSGFASGKPAWYPFHCPVWACSTLDARLRVATRHGLWILCDEAYEEIYKALEAQFIEENLDRLLAFKESHS